MSDPKHHDPMDPPSRKTAEERRDDIVEHRLGRGLAGMGAGFLTGVSVLFMDKPTGKWFIGASLLMLGGGTYYILRTILRRRRLKRDMYR